MTTVSETDATSWRAVSASRRGSSHATDVPNQDAVRCEQISRPDGSDVWVAAVADGHGGARYVRSDVGARTAVDLAVDSVRQALVAAPDTDLSDLLRAQVPRIVDTWRDAVKAHADAHPFTPAEQARAGGDPHAGGGSMAYGATLLVALVGDHGVALAQIGDGDALVRSHGFATRPVPGDERLVAGETTSLCLASAADDFRFANLSATAEPDLVLLATDGYGNSFAHADWWQGLLGDVASFVERLGFEQLEEQLPDWLEESARVGGDDVTAVLVVRRPLSVDPPATAVPAPAVPAVPDRPRTLELPGEDAARVPAVRTEPVKAARRLRAPVIAVIATVLVVLGILAAILLAGPSAPESPGDTPSDQTSTTPPADEDTGDTEDGAGRTGGDKKGGGKKDNDRSDTTPPASDPEQDPAQPPQRPTDDTGEEPEKPVGAPG